MNTIGLTRRNFLRNSTLTAGALAIGGCTSTRKALSFRKPGEKLRLGVVGAGRPGGAGLV